MNLKLDILLMKKMKLSQKYNESKRFMEKVLTSYFEVGSPFLCFKDTANRANPNSHVGHIRSSNLCTEIFSKYKPNHYKIKLEFFDGTIETYEEEDLIIVDGGITKKQIKYLHLIV